MSIEPVVDVVSVEGETKTFLEVPNPRFWRREQEPKVICHGLVKCNTCHRLWNRDENGACNIFRIANAIVYEEDRPEYLKRGQRGIPV